MVQNVFDTHSFLFTLQDNNENIEDYIIQYFLSSDKVEDIKIKSIEVGASPLSCKVITIDNEKRTLKYLRIKKIYNSYEELIWDNSDTKLGNAKIVGGY